MEDGVRHAAVEIHENVIKRIRVLWQPELTDAFISSIMIASMLSNPEEILELKCHKRLFQAISPEIEKISPNEAEAALLIFAASRKSSICFMELFAHPLIKNLTERVQRVLHHTLLETKTVVTETVLLVCILSFHIKHNPLNALESVFGSVSPTDRRRVASLHADISDEPLDTVLLCRLVEFVANALYS